MTPAILTPLMAPTVQQMSRVIGLVLLSFLERPLSAPHPPFQNPKLEDRFWRLILMNVGEGLFLCGSEYCFRFDSCRHNLLPSLPSPTDVLH